MSLVLFNDLTKKKEPFVPLHPGKVGFYVCGPTVYDFFHIGNARPFIVFDALRRYLEYSGFDVLYVQNFTDIDDKMITRSRELGISVPELAARFIQAYEDDAQALGIRSATIHPKATEHMEEIIGLIQRLEERHHAYAVGGDVYFDVQSFPTYGRLINQSLDELQSGARIDVDPRKKHPLDFALWKAQKPGEPAWESPWGPGRPGWHIECSAMSSKYCGATLDIHAGGSDLIFPHHENEVAQSEAASGQPFVRYWIHNAFLLIDAEKMSKSLGNFMTAREARRHFSPLSIRFFMLGAHYRSPLNFSEDALRQSTAAAERLQTTWREVLHARQSREDAGVQVSLRESLADARRRFFTALDDDFNTAGALGALFDTVKAINSALKDGISVDQEALGDVEAFFRTVDTILGIFGVDRPESLLSDEDVEEIDRLVRCRQTARQERNFAEADRIRQELGSRGIILEDTPMGTRWHRALGAPGA